MNIKRFVSSDMREALNAIRASLGPDAVMLSSRKVAEGVEVIAAIDYDDSLFSAAGSALDAHAVDGRGSAEAEARELRVAETRAAVPATRAYAEAEADASYQGDHAEQGRPTEYARIAAAIARGTLPTEPSELPAAAPRGAAAVHAATATHGGAPRPTMSEAATLGSAAPAAETSPAARSAGHGADAGDIGPAAGAGDGPSAQRSAERAPAVQSANAESGAALQVVGELKDLRRLLEMQLASLAWNDMNRRHPVRTRVLRQFARLGVDPELARRFADTLTESEADSSKDAWRLPIRAFSEALPLASRELTEIGGTFAVVGPTGVGKTTAIAKMAARFILRHSVHELGLVSTDAYRIGAREQLLTFARILGAPMHVAQNARELGHVLDGLASKKLVLIDTAGMSQRDVRLAKQFATLRVKGHKVNAVLALSAGADRGSLVETVSVFDSARPRALIVTKVDEATSLGPVLSVALNGRLPIAYLSDGQRVPEDLHVAGRKRVWLTQMALKLARDHALKPSEDDLAEQFAQLELAANA